MKLKGLNIIYALISFGVILTWSNPALSGTFTKAAFKASVTPPTLNLSVNAQGRISGQTQATVNVQRIKRNRVASCNKIWFVEVVRGQDFKVSESSPEFLGRFSLPGGGRCYFNHNILVTPFSDNEIQGVCRGQRPGTVKKLSADGLVTAWHDDVKQLHHMWDKGGMGGWPKNQATISFKANVTCGASSGGGGWTGGTAGGGSGAGAQHGSSLFAQCIDKNRDISVQVDMSRGIGNLYMKGNSVFNLSARYLPIRGSTPNNLIELKGNGPRKFHLNKSRQILYFREGSQGEFCKVRIQNR